MVDGLLEWIGSLNEPCEATNGLATCPYARPAFDDGKVAIVFKNKFNGESDLARLIADWSDAFDVVLLIVARTAVSAELAHDFAKGRIEQSEAKDLVVMV